MQCSLCGQKRLEEKNGTLERHGGHLQLPKKRGGNGYQFPPIVWCEGGGVPNHVKKQKVGANDGIELLPVG